MALAAVPEGEEGKGRGRKARAPGERWRPQEPVWLVRILILLFLAAFAAFLAREALDFRDSLP